MQTMIEPIKPEDVTKVLLNEDTRVLLISVFNDLIQKHWDGHEARFYMEEVTKLIVDKSEKLPRNLCSNPTRNLCSNPDSSFVKAGWDIEYNIDNKPVFIVRKKQGKKQ